MCYFVLPLDARRLEEPQIAREDRQMNLKLEQFDTNRASYEIKLPWPFQQTTTRETLRTSAKRGCRICAIILDFIHERMTATELLSGDNVGWDTTFDDGRALVIRYERQHGVSTQTYGARFEIFSSNSIRESSQKNICVFT
jgi:hypothetical protein